MCLRKHCLMLSLSFCLAISQQGTAAPTEVIGMWDEPVIIEKSTLSYEGGSEGGVIRLGSVGSFDNFNPFAPRGVCASFVGLTYETLGESERTEDYVVRGLIAESFDVARDHLSMKVRIRPEAKFSDGVAVTAKDIVWTFKALTTDANPVFKNNYRDIKDVEIIDDHTVLFRFKNAHNRELPLVASQLPVLPSHWWKGKNIGDPQKSPMPGSGPYIIESWNMGAHLKVTKNPDWWGKHLPQNTGRYNFETISVDFYRDASVMREAFFAGNLDFYAEGTIKDWKLAYDIPPVRDGRIVRTDVKTPGVFGMTGIFMNTRRPFLQDMRVRQALTLLFNFERINKTMFFNSFERPDSFWTGSESLQTRDPMTDEERKIMETLPGIDIADYERLPSLVKHASTSETRAHMREALKILAEAGWTLQEGILRNQSGEPMHLRLILSSPNMTRLFSAWASDLKRVGIRLELIPLDQTQFFNKIRHFDFDLLLSTIRQSSKPGNEQQSIWSSHSVDQIGSRNYAGIQNPAIDVLLEAISKPKSRADLANHVRVLDRILRNEHYVIPAWYSQTGHIAWWKDRITPPKGMLPEARRNYLFAWHASNKDN